MFIAANFGDCTCIDHKRGLQFAVCWDRSRFLYVCTVSSMDGIYRDL